jgi:hypothetical protein
MPLFHDDKTAIVNLSGAYTIIPVAVPANCFINGVVMRVNTAIVGVTSWNAYFSGGNASVICVNTSTAKNTKVNSFSGGYTTGVTNIVVVKNGTYFMAGSITAVVYYDYITDLPSI